MTTSEPSSQPLLHANESYSPTERAEEVASDGALVGALGLRAVEIAALVFIGLLVCPPLLILTVVVVVPLVIVALLVSLVVAVLATPYLIVSHLRGHRAGHVELRHRLRRAFHALVDLAPHRLLAAIRRSHPAR